MAKILVGVASSISLYKTLDLVSHFKKRGHEVWPILTRNAGKLVSPGLFAALAGRAPDPDLFRAAERGEMSHIRLAKDADLFLIAPATANLLAKLAGGHADDLLTTTALCVRCPTLVAPAMNPAMWEHPATVENVARLRARGVRFVDPDEGLAACGDYGAGRLASTERIREAAEAILGAAQAAPSPFRGTRIVVTAGGSSEPIDPVRMITNASSGRMALALAEELDRRGAKVTWLAGRTEVPPPPFAEVHRFTTTLDLGMRLAEIVPTCRGLFMAAAPGDFRVEGASDRKLKRNGPLTLSLVPNPDLLAGLERPSPFLAVGFAAETDDLLERARAKLSSKRLDLIVANRATGSVDGKAVGLGSDLTEFALVDASGIRSPLRVASKGEAAKAIVDAAESLLSPST